MKRTTVELREYQAAQIEYLVNTLGPLRVWHDRAQYGNQLGLDPTKQGPLGVLERLIANAARRFYDRQTAA